MKASVPFDFTDHDRALIARFLGQDMPASHVQCVAWARHQLRVTLSVMAQAKPRPAIELEKGPLPCLSTR